jgi:predicted CoA-substrate-specific enzyme activase
MTTVTAGVDIGSTHTKAAVLLDGELAGKAIRRTGFRLEQAAREALEEACEAASVRPGDIEYLTTTGYGRNRLEERDLQVTDLTAQAWGARAFFSATRTVLDVGGQTMKALRLDDVGRVLSFRLNDKCAAGTGAFLEKTARYLGHPVEEIGAVAAGAGEAVPISGVCAVFAESEVINHVSQGRKAPEILRGAMESLVEKSVRLMKRVGLEPEFTLVGGIMRFPTMVEVMRRDLAEEVNVPPGEMVQFTGAIGAAVLSARRLEQIGRAAEARTA